MPGSPTLQTKMVVWPRDAKTGRRGKTARVEARCGRLQARPPMAARANDPIPRRLNTSRWNDGCAKDDGVFDPNDSTTSLPGGPFSSPTLP